VKAVVIVIGLAGVAIGVLGIVAPAVLLDVGRSLETPAAMYVVGALRVVFGFVLIRAAAISCTPRTFRILGALLVFLGILTPFFGVERSRALLEGWAAYGFGYVRAAAGGAVVFGLFLILAVTSTRAARRTAD
jgi:hypothetical protein